MFLSYRIPVVYTVILILLIQHSLASTKSKRKICPIGFSYKSAVVKEAGDPDAVCYRLKGPEKFSDTYKDCSGNLYTAKLFDSLNIANHTEQVLWTEYKSAYLGGPFIDTSFTKTAGSLLETSFDVKESQGNIDEEYCVVKDPVGNYTAERCDKEFHRYCIVEPYSNDSASKEGCKDPEGSTTTFWRFWSPRPICLAAVTGVAGGSVRATWSQASELCEKKGGSILYSGWRYSNNPLLRTPDSTSVFPLRVAYDPSRNTTVRNGADFVRQPDRTSIDIHNPTDEISFGALRNGIWDMVNSSYVFLDVICESEIEIRPIAMNVRVDEQNKLILLVGDDGDESNITCLTDSETYHPTPVKISFEDKYNNLLSYVLKPESDGNYWCKNTDSKKFQVSETEKVLWIREEQSLKSTYAVKLSFLKEYDFSTVEQISKLWERKLKDYIYYSTKYYDNEGDGTIVDNPNFQEVLKDFKEAHPELNPKETDNVIYGMKIKKLFLDRQTAVVHFQLNPQMRPVQPGWWNNIRILSMKPVHYCEVGDREFAVNTAITIGCEYHQCIGDYIDGVQVVIESDQGCLLARTPSSRILDVTHNMPTFATDRPDLNASRKEVLDTSSSSEETTETTTDVTTMTTPPYTPVPPKPKPTTEAFTKETVATAIPTWPSVTDPTTEVPTTLAPEDQLQQVIYDLDQLLGNDTVEISIGVIANSFNKVDELLEENQTLDIPGQLLHLLDNVGARLELNGSKDVQTVGNNVALLVASAEPTQPVNGLRILASDGNAFADGDFEIIRDQVNASHLLADSSEAVVHLPSSVAYSSRRVSFVVFRNDRAFRTNSSFEQVNSRILSINVENITQFKSGESIDIHFSPTVGNTGRNQTRTCAFWDFDIEGWSQAGCTFIPATKPGMLDTCRCEHLTHFAEILVSRTVFSELDETILEYISVIGCCLSIAGVTMVMITAALFRSWRRDFSNKIWLQLCISILMLVICFLVIVFAKFSSYNIACLLTGVALHYSVLASFCWMLVAAVLAYRRLVTVFSREASHKLLRAAAFAWGAPFVVVGILLSVSPQSYAGQFEEKTPTGAFCYPSGLGLWLSVYAPIALILLVNWTLFGLIIRSVFTSRRIQRHGDSNEAVRCASVSCLLVFLFGLPWIFGLFASNVVAAYFFALTATLQGFVLFVFFVLGNKKTRDLWLNKLKIKQTRKVPVTSSTYTNRSTGGGPGWRAGVSGTVEAKVSKPRSLSNPDDSRFS